MNQEVPSREQVKQMRERLGNWSERVNGYKEKWKRSGLSEDEAQKAIQPMLSFWQREEEEVRTNEYYYWYEDQKEVIASQ